MTRQQYVKRKLADQSPAVRERLRRDVTEYRQFVRYYTRQFRQYPAWVMR